MWRVVWLVVLAVTWFGVTPSVSAQEDRTPTTGVGFDEADKAQTAKATQAYQAGVAAQQRGQHDVALAEFRRSYGIVRSPNSRMLIVRELAELGSYVQAYREGVEAVREAEDAAALDAAKYGKTVEAAQAELDAVKTQVALVVINVSGAPDSAALVLNGVAVDQAEWGRPIPVAAGDVGVSLMTSAGEVEQTATAVAGQTVEIAITPAKAPEPIVAPPPVVQEDSGLWPADWPDRKLVAIIAGGTGAVALLNFGIFGLLSEGQADRLATGCPDVDDCNPALQDEADKGRTYQTVANVFLVVGIVGATAGAGLLTWDLLDSEQAGDTADASFRANMTVGPGSLWLTGRLW